jgi:uncharacterized protein (TIGR02588 family)
VLERIVLVVSAAAIAVVVGVLVLEGVDERSPGDPVVVLHEDQARQGAMGWIVPATVRNDGDQAVEDVVVEATGIVDGAEQSSELTVMELPTRSSVEVEFAFAARPDGPISVRLVSQRIP